MCLAWPDGGSCIGNTATTDNAAQKHYLECYIYREGRPTTVHRFRLSIGITENRNLFTRFLDPAWFLFNQAVSRVSMFQIIAGPLNFIFIYSIE
jgi:hypothetical protein